MGEWKALVIDPAQHRRKSVNRTADSSEKDSTCGLLAARGRARTVLSALFVAQT
jgi:hypothetical protein